MKYDIVEDNIKIGNKIIYSIDKDILDIIHSLEKENKILKENSYHNDKVVDKVNWENMLLKKENQELKKQIETLEKANKQLIYKLDRYDAIVDERDELKKQLENKYSRTGALTNEVLYEENTKLINQQKEFIEYMTKAIKELDSEDVDDEEMKGYLIQRIDTFKEILLKFKEIIGGK